MKNYCILYIVRHGETNWNVKKIIQGHEDIPLNMMGEMQAKDLAAKLRKIKFDFVYSSDLMRAKRTAEIIAMEKKLMVQTTKALRERYFGKYQGKYIGKNRELIELIDSLQKTSIEAKEVETPDQVVSRLIIFLRGVAVAHLGKKGLIVSHGGPMRLLLIHLGFAQPSDFKESRIENTAYIKLKSDGVDFFVEETFGIKKIKKNPISV